jgi:hypothetical protein
MGVACGRAGPAGLPSGTGSIHARLGAGCRVRQHPGHGNHRGLARQALPARAQEQAEDVALLDPLPVLGGQVILAIAVPAGRLAGRGVRRRPVLAGAESWITECPSRMISRCRVFAGAGKSPSVNISFFKPDWASLSNTQAH